MSQMDFEFFNQFLDKEVVIRSTAGEVINAKVLFVSMSERDLIYDLIHTSEPERYVGDEKGTAFSIPWEYVEAIRKRGDNGNV